MSKDDKAIFYHKPQTFQWTPADGVFSFGENRKEQNMIRYYSVPKETFVTNGTIVEPLNVTENGTYAPPAGTAYSPVVVNVEGGSGGSSDFSTAAVTVVNNSADQIICDIANIQEDSGTYYTMGSVPAASGTTANITAILYKNDCTLVLPDSVTVAITGDATDLGDGYIDITGDCAITIS